jgi:hypothetical protein
MAQGDDAWDYFNAMAAFPPPQLPIVPTYLRACNADLRGSDSTYRAVCPDPWVQVAAAPDANTAQLVFSKAYFDWAQQYVREAVMRKPSSSASAKAKVLWVLDVATVMTLGMVATNIPLSGAHPFFNAWGPIRQEFTGNLGLMRANMLSRYSAYPKDQTAIKNAPIIEAPFMRFPLEWAHGYMRNDKTPDRIYTRIYGALTLQGGWEQFKNFTPKFYNEWQAAGARGDAPLERGMQQWWLWCVRDGVGTDTQGTLITPLNTGAWDDRPELSWYINTVQNYEAQTPELVRKTDNQGDVLYPNFATTFESYQRMAAPFTGMRFDKVVQTQLTRWLQASIPRVDSNNRPLLDAWGYPLQSPVTFEDAALFFKQDGAAVAAAADAAVRNPSAAVCAQAGVSWSGSNVSVPQVPGQVAYVADVAGQSSALSIAQSIPQSVHVPSCSEIASMGAAQLRSNMGPFAGMMDWLGSVLLKKYGAALGVGWRLPVISQPFVRTFTMPGYSTVPDGSTVDVLPRVMTAVANLGPLVGVQLCAECAPLTVAQQQQTQQQLIDKIIAASRPGFQKLMESPEYQEAMRQKIIAASLPGFQKLVNSPAYRKQLVAQAQSSKRGRFVYNFTHPGDPFVAPTTAETSFKARFLASFTRAGNPIRRS